MATGTKFRKTCQHNVSKRTLICTTLDESNLIMSIMLIQEIKLPAVQHELICEKRMEPQDKKLGHVPF